MPSCRLRSRPLAWCRAPRRLSVRPPAAAARVAQLPPSSSASRLSSAGAAPRTPGRGADRTGVRAAAPALGGRLAVGTHLPLLGRRYRYLSLLGEGASAQARPHPGPRSHARRARARPCGAAGTRPRAPAPRRGWAAPRPGREPPGPLLTSPRQQLAYVGEATAGVTVTAGCLTLRGSWARGRIWPSLTGCPGLGDGDRGLRAASWSPVAGRAGDPGRGCAAGRRRAGGDQGHAPAVCLRGPEGAGPRAGVRACAGQRQPWAPQATRPRSRLLRAGGPPRMPSWCITVALLCARPRRCQAARLGALGKAARLARRRGAPGGRRAVSGRCAWAREGAPRASARDLAPGAGPGSAASRRPRPSRGRDNPNPMASRCAAGGARAALCARGRAVRGAAGRVLPRRPRVPGAAAAGAQPAGLCGRLGQPHARAAPGQSARARAAAAGAPWSPPAPPCMCRRAQVSMHGFHEDGGIRACCCRGPGRHLTGRVAACPAPDMRAAPGPALPLGAAGE